MIESNVVFMTSVSYDYYEPINKRSALIFGGEYIMGTGFGSGMHWIVPEIGILSYGPKHFLETSFQFAMDITPTNEDNEEYGPQHSIGARIAYKLQSKGGFNFRVNSNIYFGIDPIFFPTLGLGYSF
jgi:hypothetical protein